MFTKQIPPFLLGEVEWPDAIASGDLLFWIPVQQMDEYDGVGDVHDLTNNYSFRLKKTDNTVRIAYDASLDSINLLLGELFWDDATKTPKWVVIADIGTNYLGKNLLFQCTTGEPYSDLILFATPRTSSTSPSIEQVAAYLQLTPGDIVTFNGVEFTFGGRPVRF